MTLAMCLSKRGFKVAVYEQESDFIADRRAYYFHPYSLEIFDELGILDDVKKQGMKVVKWNYVDGDNKEVIATFESTLIKDYTNYPYEYSLRQDRLSRIIHTHLASNENVEVHFDCKVVAATQNNEGVEVTIETADGTKKVQGSYLCGADGGASTMRKDIMQMEMQGVDYPEHFFTIDIKKPDDKYITKDVEPFLTNVALVVGREIHGVCVTLDEGLHRFVTPLTQDENDDDYIDDQAAHDLIVKMTGKEFPYELISSKIYKIHQLCAKQFVKGRFILLGDAAHMNSPIGGLGLNSGVQDAYVLAESFQVLLGGDGQALQNYQQLRQQIVKDYILTASDTNHKMVSATQNEQSMRQFAAMMKGIATDKRKAKAFILERLMPERPSKI